MPEKAAQMFIQQGKLVPVFEPANDLNERMAIMGENTSPEEIKPYVTDYGVLVIPWNSDPRYHYWKKGGLGICVTLKELGASDETIKRYKYYLN